jgi:hypothetical protein
VTRLPRLAAALASRLGPVSLPGRVTEEWLLDALSGFDDVEEAARAALAAVQEAMIEATELPWPEAFPDWDAGPPAPGARLFGEELRLWYGSETSPVLLLEPIRRSEFA